MSPRQRTKPRYRRRSPMLKITIDLSSTLELEALESALDIFVESGEDRLKCDEDMSAREKAAVKAGRALLARIRGEVRS